MIDEMDFVGIMSHIPSDVIHIYKYFIYVYKDTQYEVYELYNPQVLIDCSKQSLQSKINLIVHMEGYIPSFEDKQSLPQSCSWEKAISELMFRGEIFDDNQSYLEIIWKNKLPIIKGYFGYKFNLNFPQDKIRGSFLRYSYPPSASFNCNANIVESYSLGLNKAEIGTESKIFISYDRLLRIYQPSHLDQNYTGLIYSITKVDERSSELTLLSKTPFSLMKGNNEQIITFKKISNKYSYILTSYTNM